MENVFIFVTIIGIVWGILQVILFFKLWQMCDDVKSIHKMLQRDISNLINIMSQKQEQSNSQQKPKPNSSGRKTKSNDVVSKDFKKEQLVIVKSTENQFRIDSIEEDKNGNKLYCSKRLNQYFSEDEIEDFDTYWNNKKQNT